MSFYEILFSLIEKTGWIVHTNRIEIYVANSPGTNRIPRSRNNVAEDPDKVYLNKERTILYKSEVNFLGQILKS